MSFTGRPVNWWVLWVFLGCTWGLCGRPLVAAEMPVRPGDRFAANDSVSLGDEAHEDARQCLAGLSWHPTAFEVHCEQSHDGYGDVLVRFPSPVNTEDAVNDVVAMEWYAARDERGMVLRAPAMVVVHESGRRMPVGRMIARGLQSQKVHTFMIQLPGYGVRESPNSADDARLLVRLKQAIADVRRARDAVAALPCVDSNTIGLQGTSLGGFVAATVAGLDRGYHRTFILLAGGDLHRVIQEGARDVESLREKLKQAGIQGEQLRELTRSIEPLRLAHRIDPRTTWLYSGKLDDVVPPACSQALADAARLPESHHIRLPADHYLGIVYLPNVLLEIHRALVRPASEL